MKRFLAYALILMLLFACACGEKANAPIETPEIVPETPAPTLTPNVTPGAAAVDEDALKLSTCIIRCDDAINMRSAPSSRAELIRQIPAGTRVRVIEFEKRYAYVELVDSGEKGYISAGYLQPETDVYNLNIVSITDRYSYEQMRMDLDALQAAYEPRAKVEIAGKSVQGRDIPVLVMGDPNAPYQVFVQASIHAREHMTALLVMALSEAWLASGGGADVCFHVMPMSNPDGVAISQNTYFDENIKAIFAGDYSAGRTQLIEEKYRSQWKANYNGVDINRNFDALWENVNTVPEPSSEGYRGAAPGSEPETRALVNYTQSHDFDLTISYHATGSLIYWQFGPNTPADEAAHAIAQVLGGLMGYSVERDDGTSFGGYKDWASSKCGIPSLTIEIGTREAPLPVEDFYNIWARNRLVFKTVAEWVKSA